jgi:hypothetical protein
VVLGIRSSKTPKGNTPKGNTPPGRSQGVKTVKKVVIKKPASSRSRHGHELQERDESHEEKKKVAMKVMKVTKPLGGSMVGNKAR